MPGAGPGQAYGYRVNGPFEPARGLRCNPNKLLLDPYARAFSGQVTYGPELLGHDPAYDWAGDIPPGRSYADTIVYEVHVKGFTMRHLVGADHLHRARGSARPGVADGDRQLRSVASG